MFRVDFRKEVFDHVSRPRRRNQLDIRQEFRECIEQGIARANKTLREIKSAWVKEQEVTVKDGRIVAYKVNLLVTFVLEDTL